MTCAIIMFLKSAVNHDGIPFEIKRRLTIYKRTALDEYEGIKANLEKYKRYHFFNEVIDYESICDLFKKKSFRY